MTPIKVKSTSWHFRLAETYASKSRDHLALGSSCDYIKAVLQGMFAVLFIISASVIMIISLAAPVWTILAHDTSVFHPGMFIVGCVMWIAIGWIAAVNAYEFLFGKKRAEKRIDEIYELKVKLLQEHPDWSSLTAHHEAVKQYDETRPLRRLWKSFRDKVCFPMEIE